LKRSVLPPLCRRHWPVPLRRLIGGAAREWQPWDSMLWPLFVAVLGGVALFVLSDPDSRV
jgi:hypothetical protein